MKKYEEYKVHLYDWLPEIPSCWESLSLRSVFSLADERKEDRTDLELLSVYRDYGVIPKASRTDNKNVESENTSKYKVVKKGDLVINKMKLWQGSLGISQYDGFVSPAYIVAHCEFDGNLHFLNLLLRSPLMKTYYNRISYGIRVGQWDSDFYDFKQLMIPVPPREEQDQIVRFLDYKISGINSLIKGYQKQIELLRQRRYSVVSSAVTHGLNKEAVQKDSGVSWLGKIPAHWEIRKLRTILFPVSEKNHPEMQLLSVVREQGVIIRDTADKTQNHNYIPDDLSGYKVVRKNQFVINKMKSWQGSYGVSLYDGIVSPAYFIFNIDFPNLEYFHYAIRSKVYVNFFAQASDGIRVGQWDLDMQKMKEIPFIVPSEIEQNEIVQYIRLQQEKIDTGITEIQKEIDLLREYRTRLISDVVTGQIDVRDEIIPEYTVVEDEPDTTEDEETSFDSDSELPDVGEKSV